MIKAELVKFSGYDGEEYWEVVQRSSYKVKRKLRVSMAFPRAYFWSYDGATKFKTEKKSHRCLPRVSRTRKRKNFRSRNSRSKSAYLNRGERKSQVMEKIFRTKLSNDIFNNKYRHDGCETWEELAHTLTHQVVSPYFPKDVVDGVFEIIRDMKFIPGGRYLYYAGRSVKFFNNCYLLRAEEDTREDWADLSWKSESCLLTGGGIGTDYSVYRDSESIIRRTGGKASGPVPKMLMVNEIGRRIMQGGSRRSAIYASLDETHGDIFKFLEAKNWHDMPVGSTGKSLWDIKQEDFDFPAPLDMTNISVNYKTDWLLKYKETGDYGNVFLRNVEQALRTGEPGFSFNFFEKENETLRNACTEVTSEDDSDVCNLGSLNISRIESIKELEYVTELATIFLLCGTLEADLPYEKVSIVREKNRRLGLGKMGMHEWLLQRNYRYEVTPELHEWLGIYRGISDWASWKYSNQLGISKPVANRAIAPTGTIGMVAGTTTGIEPVYAVAYKRRYLKGTRWHYQYAVDHAAQTVIDQTGIDPEKVESAIDLAEDFERRIKFQADVQDYVDMSISSTINLPQFDKQKFTTKEFADTLAKYAGRLRGFTCYPDGSRGGQPLTSVSYNEAHNRLGEEFEEAQEWLDVCDITGGGYCGT